MVGEKIKYIRATILLIQIQHCQPLIQITIVIQILKTLIHPRAILNQILIKISLTHKPKKAKKDTMHNIDIILHSS